MRAQLIIMVLVAVVLILVTVQNPNPVSLQFLSWETRQVPQIVIILVSLLSGIIISTFLGLIKQSRLKERIRRLEEEIEELKQPPVVPSDEESED